MELEIYTTGGAVFLTTTLNAIAAFAGTNDFGAMINIGLAAGLFVMIFQVMWGGGFADMLKMYCVVGLVGGLSVGPRADVIIFDKTVSNLPVAAVGNVPLSVAYVGHITSTFSEVVTRRMEALLSPPTSISYQQSGMLFGATLQARTVRWRAVSGSLHENLVNFFDQCMIDAVSLRYVTPGALAQSGDLAATITAEMPNSLAYYDVDKRLTVLCKDGWPDIETALEADVEKVLGRQAAAIYQVPAGGPEEAGPAAINRLKTQIADFASFSGVAATDAVENIKHSMLIAALDDAALRSVSASGNSAAMEHLQAARAEAQTRSSYGAIGTQALAWVPYLKIVFENLYYGAFPFALFLMMTPYALAVARGYFGGFVWLASWEPLSAILHSIVLNAAVGDYRAVTTTGSDGVLDAAVISWANHFGVYSVQQDVASLAGYLMMSIPFISSVLFFGANRMVGLATSTLAVSQSAASETGREMATGNFSYGNASVGNKTFENFSRGNYSKDNWAQNNASWDNVSANRHVTSPYRDTTRSTLFSPGGSEIITNADGSIAINSGSMASRTATSVGLGQSVVSNLETRASTAFEKSGQQRVAAERGLSQIESQTSSFAQAVSNGQTFTTTDGTNMSDDARTSATESISTIDRFAQSHNISRQTAVSLAFTAKAGGSWGMLSAEARSELSRTGYTVDNFDAAKEAVRQSGVEDAVTSLRGTFNSLSQADQDSLTRTADRGMRTSIDDVTRHSRSAEALEREAQAFSTAASRAESRFVDGKVDLSQAYVDYMITGRGFSPTQAADILSGRPEYAALAETLRQDFLNEYIADIHGPEISDYIAKPLPGTLSAPDAPQPGYRPGDYLTGNLPEFNSGSTEVRTGILNGQRQAPNAEAARAPQEQKADDRQETVEGAWTLSSQAHRFKGSPWGVDKTEQSFEAGPDGSVNFGDTRNAYPAPAGAQTLSAGDRDLVIRTIYAEAAGEPLEGQLAVAHVIRNRVADPSFGSTAGKVVSAPRQFSAWNADRSGNDLGQNLAETSRAYAQIGTLVDAVFDGRSSDPTGGATHYYSPAGMRQHVEDGYQSNIEPTWLAEKTAERGEPNVRIGGHIFTGKAK